MKERKMTEYGNRSHRAVLRFFVRKSPRSPNEEYREIRRLIREVRYGEALERLEKIDPRLRGHEWNFLNGCALLEKGYFVDGQRFVELAYKAKPDIEEYRVAYRKTHGRRRIEGRDVADFCLELGCECCLTGACEVLCDSCG